MNSVEFLDAARAALSVDSDNKLAAALGVPRDRISKVRTGARKLDDNLSKKIAEALDLDPIYVMLCVQAERAKGPEIEVIWRRAAEKVVGAAKRGAAALAIILLGSGAMAPMPADAGLQAAQARVTVYTLYA